ncbi:MAG: hypothetical protein GW941_00650 [Candidatus Pacebacteria bacterium]|nr:hypothetical protein [Candidatus Paceibacterota bacterium]
MASISELGSSIDNPIVKSGDYYHVLRNLIERGNDIYFKLNEMVLYLSITDRRLELVEVSSGDKSVILSAIFQSLMVAESQGCGFTATEKLLAARSDDFDQE